jgi:hypothetical protein
MFLESCDELSYFSLKVCPGALAANSFFPDITCSKKTKAHAHTLRIAQLRRVKVAKPLGYEG